MDSGSEVTFITEKLTKQLQLSKTTTSLSVTGIGGSKVTHTLGCSDVKLSSNCSNEHIIIRAHILKKLTTLTPSSYVKNHQWPHLRQLQLADPEFYRPSAIDIIIGADYYGSIVKQQFIKLNQDSPVALLTIFGWIIIGPVNNLSTHPSAYTVLNTQQNELNELLTRFWVQEEISIPSSLTSEEEECEKHFQTTHTRDSSGRYVVRLPLKEDRSALGNSYWTAFKCLQRMKKRLDRDPILHELYFDFMLEYERLGHMRKISKHELERIKSHSHYYLPHHGVLRPDSSTTKLRVVFNGSSSSSTGKSINDIMHTGENLLLNIMDVLLWIRQYKYIFSTDITKMYRQISVHQEDRNLQLILWFDDEHRECTYQLTTVTYGTRAAPFLATRSLLQLVEDEGQHFPLAVPSLTHGRYVDDIFGGADTTDQLSKIAYQLIDLCNAGGFPLAKWHSTDTNLLKELSPENNLNEISLDDCETKLLGLSWNSEKDIFTFKSKFGTAQKTFTKRLVLSEVAQIFDPLGFISPVVIKAKVLLQELWTLRLGWDDPLPIEISSTWLKIREQLNSLASVSVPRWFGGTYNSYVELHGFADASQIAMAACVYLVIISTSSERHTILTCSKTKVAPLKRLTIPRLELTAALILAKLTAHLQKILNLQIRSTHLWTDSKVTLHWINSHPSRWKDYVRNRVVQIHELTNNIIWQHVPGIENPADCATRGVTTDQLKQHALWWTGPQWLTLPPNKWPPQESLLHIDSAEEARPTISLVSSRTISTECEIISRISSLNKLLRVTALCIRFKGRLLRQLTRPPIELNSEDLFKAQLIWVRKTQRHYYSEELKALSKGELLPKGHVMSRLTAFLDKNDIIRVGGRLDYLEISYEEKHPAIIPRHSPLTALIIDEAHRATLHGGTQLTLSRLRQKYWIIGGRAPVRSHILKCVICARQRGIKAQQLMGKLPLARISPSRPFTHTGVDYAGPVQLKTWKGRGSKLYKGWICIFVCFATSAAHLELVTDYSAEGFIAAYRRFVSRRGTAHNMYSDCGTNFIGADKALKQLFQQGTAQNRTIEETMTTHGTVWNFNPPASPHMGGKWEAVVKSVKYHLNRTLKETVLTYEEYSTLLTQIEAILNSRPLEPLSDDPDDVSALTPGHFLIGTALNAIPEPSLLDLSSSRLSRWQFIQQRMQHFWSLWSAHHLQRSQSISKWHHPSNLVKVGSLVLITDERLPPCKWPLARVLELHKGKDGLTRVVTLKTATSTLTRPIVKLAHLPITTDTSTDS